MESKTPLEISIIERLRPSFHELLTNGEYFDKYHQTLDNITSCFNLETKEVVIRHINNNLDYYFSNSPEHHAYADVAMCLEENDAEQYAGKFKYY